MATTQVVTDIIRQAEALYQLGDLVAASQLFRTASQMPLGLTVERLGRGAGFAGAISGRGTRISRRFATRSVLGRGPGESRRIAVRSTLLCGSGSPAPQGASLRAPKKRAVIEEILAQCTVTGNTPEPSVALPAVNSKTFPQRPSVPVSEPEKVWESSLSYDDWWRSVFRQRFRSRGPHLRKLAGRFRMGSARL